MYQTIGYFVYSEVRRLAKAYHTLKDALNSAITTRVRVAEIFSAAQLDPLKTKHYTFTTQRMMGLSSAASGNDASRELMVFIASLLNVCGRAPALPPRIGLRTDPSVSPAEAVWLVALSYIDLNKFKTYLPPVTTSITAADIGDAVFYMIKDFEKWDSMIKVLEPRMSALVGNIKYKLKMGQGIDAFEKSLYMHAAHPVYGVEVRFREPVSKTTLADSVLATETGDPLVSTFAERLKGLVLPGPKFTYIPLISNAAMESLFATYGPYPSKAVTSAGWIASYEPYSALDLKPMSAPIVITPDDHLLGLMSAGQLTKNSTISDTALGRAETSKQTAFRWNYDAVTFTREAVCTRNSESTMKVTMPVILDLPEVDLIWHNDRVMLRFNSELLGRTVITAEAEGIMYELARKSKQHGGSSSFRSSLDEFQLADLQDVQGNITKAEDMKVKVIYYSLAKGTEIVAPVDLRPFFAQYGDKIIKPAFSSFCNPPLHLLETPQPGAVDYICLALSLTTYERLMSIRALTICYNAFLLKTFFNVLPNISVGQVSSTEAAADDEKNILSYAKTALFRKA